MSVAMEESLVDIDYLKLLPEEVWEKIIEYTDPISFIRMSAVCRVFYNIIRSPRMMLFFETQFQFEPVLNRGKSGEDHRCHKFDIFGRFHGLQTSIKYAWRTETYYCHGKRNGYDINIKREDTRTPDGTGKLVEHFYYYDTYKMGTLMKSASYLLSHRDLGDHNLRGEHFGLEWIFDRVNRGRNPSSIEIGSGKQGPWLNNYVELYHGLEDANVSIKLKHALVSDIYGWIGYKLIYAVPMVKVYINSKLRSIIHYEETPATNPDDLIMIIDYFDQGRLDHRSYTGLYYKVTINFHPNGSPRVMHTYSTYSIDQIGADDVAAFHNDATFLNGTALAWNNTGVLTRCVQFADGYQWYDETLNVNGNTEISIQYPTMPTPVNFTFQGGRDDNDRITSDILHKLIMMYGLNWNVEVLQDVFGLRMEP